MRVPKLVEKQRILDIPIFEFSVVVILTNDIKRSALKRKNILDIREDDDMAWTEFSCGLTVDSLQTAYVFLPFYPRGGTRNLIISHESSHAATSLLRSMNGGRSIGICQNNEELLAYAVGYIAAFIHKVF